MAETDKEHKRWKKLRELGGKINAIRGEDWLIRRFRQIHLENQI